MNENEQVKSGAVWYLKSVLKDAEQRMLMYLNDCDRARESLATAEGNLKAVGELCEDVCKALLILKRAGLDVETEEEANNDAI